MSPIGRLAWLVAGGLWAARSLIGFQNPEYWNPVTTLDFVSIWLFSACFLTLAPAILLITRLAPVRAVNAIAAVVALAAVGAGIANGAEDGLDVRWAGTLYILGSLTTFFGTLALGIALASAGYRRLGVLVAVIFVGFLLFTVGGGFVMLASFAAVAARPGWFATREGTSEPATSASPEPGGAK